VYLTENSQFFTRLTIQAITITYSSYFTKYKKQQQLFFLPQKYQNKTNLTNKRVINKDCEEHILYNIKTKQQKY